MSQNPERDRKVARLAADYAGNRVTAPEWQDDALVVKCAMCLQHPGAKYWDGSGVCDSCGGAAYKVLAVRNDTRKV